MALYQYLWIYDDLDVPIDGAGNATASTNPAHARPYLIHTMETAESEVNFLEGRSTIGQINIRVLDVRLTATDQTTGWFTNILANSGGENKLVGRRINLDMRDASGVFQFGIFDGVINEISLDADNVTYTIVTRDVRDNERAQPLFNITNGSTSVHPPGITAGYGTHNLRNIPQKLIPAAQVIGGLYTSFSDVNGGQVRLDKSAQSITPQMYLNWYDPLNQTGQRFASDGTSLGSVYPNVIVRWRDEATHGAWNTFTNMPVPAGTFRKVFETDSQIFKIDINSPNLLELVMSSYDLIRFFSDGTGAFTLPTNGQRVEVQLLSNLPPSELYPFWWEGNLGQLLKDIYDGVYSYTNPKIRYNAAAMTAFIAATPTARLRITAPVEDMRPWVEENIYKPMGYAPAVNVAGEIVPVPMFLPDVSVTPVNLDDSNCRSASWKHTSSDSVTKVTWKWKSEFATGTRTPKNYKPPKPIVDVIGVADRSDVHLAASAVYVGTKEVVYEPETLRDIGSGDFDSTFGVSRQAMKISRALIDRLRFGGQHIMVLGAKRSDTGVASLKVGDWVVCGFSNLPDYGTHKRGMSRLAQVIKIRDVDPISRDMELLDSGPSGAPLSTPTLGTVTVSLQTVSVPVTAVAGTEVAIEYALSVAQPATGSPLWERAARGGTGTYTLPLLPVGTSVWVRARSEAVSKRPSAWTTAQNVTTQDIPYPTLVDVQIDSTTQHAVVTWTPNGAMAGARIYYAITGIGVAIPNPLVTFVDADASLGTKDIGLTNQGDTVTTEVEGWTGWTGSAVSGTQGRKARATLTRPVDTQISLLCRATVQSTSATQVVVRVAVADPFPAANISIAYANTGVGTITPASPQTILAVNVTNDINTTGFVDFTINRSAFGTGTGRIAFTAHRVDRLDSTDSADVPTLDRDTLALSMRLLRVSETASQVVIRVEVISPIAGQTITVNYDNGGLTVTPSTGGTLTSTTAFGTTNHIDYTITRDRNSGTPRRVTFTASATGYVDATDGIDVLPDANRLRCQIYHSANQAVATGTPVIIAWDSEVFDTGSLHDTVTNNKRITIPTGGDVGCWLIMAQIYWQANATGNREVLIRKNGATTKTFVLAAAAPGGTVNDPTVMQVIYLEDAPSVSDYFEILVIHNAGVSLNVEFGQTKSFASAVHLF